MLIVNFYHNGEKMNTNVGYQTNQTGEIKPLIHGAI